MKHTGGIGFIVASALLAAGCASTRSAHRTDPAIATAATAARLAFDEGNLEQAATLYRRALTRARATDDSNEISNNAYNLAACLVARGSLESAQALLQEADREAVRAGAPRGDILLMRARVARLSSRPETADALLKEFMRLAERPEDRALADILYADMACDAGDLERAEARLKGITRSRAFTSGEPSLQAEMDGVAGRLAELQKRHEAAAGRFDQQAAHLRAAGMYRAMAEALGRAAVLYGTAGNWSASWDRAYRAARCLFAQGDLNGALHQVEQALHAAENDNDESCRAATAALVEEIRTAVRQAEAKPAGAAGD